jgi:O-acetyl-ADP-ribose deacetylase (regulator of RNase III)
MQHKGGKIGCNDIRIMMGDMTAVAADAYIVPEFPDAASYGGVGGAISRSGGKYGLEWYQRFVDQKGQQTYGQVVLTPSGGGNAPFHLHVVSVGSGSSNEFDVVQTGFYNALKVAEHYDLQQVAAPAMGTGVIGRLSSKQSARAMMSAVHRYGQEGRKPLNVTFAILGRTVVFEEFIRTFETGAYIGEPNQSR